MAKVATAVLSTTAKVKAREKKKAAAEGESMDMVIYVAHDDESTCSCLNRTNLKRRIST